MRQTILLALSNISESRLICAALLMHPKYKVVHICETCAEAREYIINNRPDIALIDGSLENKCGVLLAKKLRDLGATTKLAVLTSNNDKHIMRTALEYGVLGYISHKKINKQVVKCLDLVSTNRHFIDQGLFKTAN